MAKHCISADRIVPSRAIGHRSPRLRRRRPALEILEGRSFLNSSQPAPGNPDPASLSPTSLMVAGYGGDMSADAQQQSNDGVIALLFDPHQPKSALPANVTFAGGPPLQQGAPPRYSYNLQDNILGAGALGPEAMFVASEGINAPIPFPEQVIDIVGKLVKENFEAFVASTPFGVPNFSFGPDTRVLGPQLAPSHQPKAENEPGSGESGGATSEDESAPADEGAPHDDSRRGASANDRDVRESPRQLFGAGEKAPQETPDGTEAAPANFIAPALGGAACRQMAEAPPSAIGLSCEAKSSSSPSSHPAPNVDQPADDARLTRRLKAPIHDRSEFLLVAVWGLMMQTPAVPSDDIRRRNAAERRRSSRAHGRLRVRFTAGAWTIKD